jgi:hypothetical protein
MKVDLYLNGVCIRFQCKCNNKGKCDTCKLLEDYSKED